MALANRSGWNGSSGTRKPTPVVPKRHLASKIAIGLVAAIGLGVAWFVMHDKQVSRPVEHEERTKRMPDVTPPVIKRTPEKAKEGGSELKVPKPSGKRIEQRDAVPAPLPLEELEAKLKEPPPKATFTNGAEQLIALATPASPGARVPPLPDLTDDGVATELEAAMNLPVVAEEGDSEEIINKKLVVLNAKDEFSELNASEGMTFVEYLNAVRDKSNEDADFLKEALKLNDELYHDAEISDEDYQKYQAQINEKLRERGLPEIE